VGWKFTSGRDFSRVFSTDSAALVINEAAVKFMNLDQPIGKKVIWHDQPVTIIGVIKDMVMESPYDPVKQTVYHINYENVNWINLKLDPAKSTSESLASVKATFKKFIPSVPFDYQFVDESFNEKFEAEERVGTLAAGFAGLAVFISCLGLFGLASFAAEQRTKEIGIRKVLGATVNNLWGLLSRDFVVLVMISCLLATPLAYHYLHGWLQQYQYRTEISWWVFGLAAAGALVITLLTVSFQAIRAAMANPVKSLKSE
jgi:ABC-type antimicrobial peptide transport system permease subunit